MKSGTIVPHCKGAEVTLAQGYFKYHLPTTRFWKILKLFYETKKVIFLLPINIILIAPLIKTHLLRNKLKVNPTEIYFTFFWCQNRVCVYISFYIFIKFWIFEQAFQICLTLIMSPFSKTLTIHSILLTSLPPLIWYMASHEMFAPPSWAFLYPWNR